MNRSSLMHKAVGILCALAVTASGPAAFAAEPEGQTVHVTLYADWHIYVDTTPIYFADENDTFYYPLSYNDNLYIPLQTASEWLGSPFSWDEGTGTVTLTTGGEPYYRHAIQDQTKLTEEEQVQLREDLAHGLSASLRPDIQVYLNGEEQAFTNAAGEATPPIVCRGAVFLPLRGVAAMCGKEITYIARQKASPGVMGDSSVSDFDLLFEPVLQWGSPPQIFLYDRPTEEQLEEAQAYLDRAEALLYDGPVADTAAFMDHETMSNEEAVEWLRRIDSCVEAFAELPRPEVSFMDIICDNIVYYARDVRIYVTEDEIAAFQEGVLHGLYEGMPYNYQRVNWETFENVATEKLYRIRFEIAQGQQRLDTVRSQLGL